MIDSSNKIKLYWIEEQEIFQRLFRAIFNPESQFEVINTSNFGDFETLKDNLSKKHPDILMLGIRNITLALLRELSQIQHDYPGVGIILLASILRPNELPLIRQFIDNTRSAFGFCFKKSLTRTDQIFNMISLVSMGQKVIDPALSLLLSNEKDKSQIPGRLTAREMEILNLIAKGYTNTAISAALCIDVKTVRHHINNIYSKMHTADDLDHKHPRVSATNAYLKLTGQLVLDDCLPG